jgi:hypothetical protein
MLRDGFVNRYRFMVFLVFDQEALCLVHPGDGDNGPKGVDQKWQGSTVSWRATDSEPQFGAEI